MQAALVVTFYHSSKTETNTQVVLVQAELWNPSVPVLIPALILSNHVSLGKLFPVSPFSYLSRGGNSNANLVLPAQGTL